MSTLRQWLGELVGLFVEDGTLALAILAVVAGAAILAAAAVPPIFVGLLLLGSCLAVLVENVVRSRHKAAR